MKTLHRFALATAAALALALIPVVTDAVTTIAPKSQAAALADKAQSVATFEPAVVASGVAVDFVIDTKAYRALDCQFRTSNEAGGASRLIIPKCVDSSKTVMRTYPTTTLATNSDQEIQWDPDGAPTNIGLPPRLTVYPVRPCRYMNITAAAANGLTQAMCTLRSH
jgi:hypothetical protein